MRKPRPRRATLAVGASFHLLAPVGWGNSFCMTFLKKHGIYIALAAFLLAALLDRIFPRFVIQLQYEWPMPAWSIYLLMFGMFGFGIWIGKTLFEGKK